MQNRTFAVSDNVFGNQKVDEHAESKSFKTEQGAKGHDAGYEGGDRKRQGRRQKVKNREKINKKTLKIEPDRDGDMPRKHSQHYLYLCVCMRVYANK